MLVLRRVKSYHDLGKDRTNSLLEPLYTGEHTQTRTFAFRLLASRFVMEQISVALAT